MDQSGAASRFRLVKPPSSDRFLGVFTHSRSGTDDLAAGEELNEDDVFWTADLTTDNSHFSTAPSTSADLNHHHAKGYVRPENFGILAALPAADSDQNLQSRSVFNHKASVASSSSASSTSSARMIPAMPKKPPLDRQGSTKYQSAPVNVPVLSDAMRRNRAIREFDDIVVDDDDDGNDGDFAMLPPHEMVASKHSPMVSCSVLEGVGRTLKGRDLRQVRNAIWRKTGFLD